LQLINTKDLDIHVKLYNGAQRSSSYSITGLLQYLYVLAAVAIALSLSCEGDSQPLSILREAAVAAVVLRLLRNSACRAGKSNLIFRLETLNTVSYEVICVTELENYKKIYLFQK
jgi:hypothetical protein